MHRLFCLVMSYSTFHLHKPNSCAVTAAAAQSISRSIVRLAHPLACAFE